MARLLEEDHSARISLTRGALAAIAQKVVAEPLSVTSTMNASEVDALITAGSATEKVDPWEISKLYQAAFLRNYLQDHETLPTPIVVPAVSKKVFDPDGNPASDVRLVSHTPRHWVDLDAALALKPLNSGGVRVSKQNGTFGLPERTEPYCVLFVHESGIANVSHEELLRASAARSQSKATRPKVLPVECFQMSVGLFRRCRAIERCL